MFNNITVMALIVVYNWLILPFVLLFGLTLITDSITINSYSYWGSVLVYIIINRFIMLYPRYEKHIDEEE